MQILHPKSEDILEKLQSKTGWVHFCLTYKAEILRSGPLPDIISIGGIVQLWSAWNRLTGLHGSPEVAGRNLLVFCFFLCLFFDSLLGPALGNRISVHRISRRIFPHFRGGNARKILLKPQFFGKAKFFCSIFFDSLLLRTCAIERVPPGTL